jgi:primosomal protein N' (replication factor Y)
LFFFKEILAQLDWKWQQGYIKSMSYVLVSILKRPGEFDQPLTYEVPPELVSECQAGRGVSVPLRGKQVRGLIVGVMRDLSEPIKDVKPVTELIPELVLSPRSVKLAGMIAAYYQCSLLRALKLFIPKFLWQGKGKRILGDIEKADYKRPDVSRFPLVDFEFELTSDQQDALDNIRTADKPVLLHGVTGSGKTEIYLRAILDAVRQGKQAILLVPEIALTPQTIGYFEKYFGEHLALFHSKLSDGERLREYIKVQSGYAPLVIGSRSAVFAPADELGLVILDEEHEWTYKQESSPYYESHTVAGMLSALSGCRIVFGTATPRLETFHKAGEGEYEYIRLPHRINKTALPEVRIVDLREELQRKNYSIFSGLLFSKIKDRLEKGEQVILFVNQRGVARAVMCRDCGQSLMCPACEVSLKLHGGSYGSASFLLCHYCAYRCEPKLSCAACGSVNIKQVGIGTERVEEEVLKAFPQARVVRADKDTTSDKPGFEPIYQAFKKREYDILVGTQMVAKGLDFPDVTLIGIILADIGLHIPDFRSHERLFHLITQVAGRAGRGTAAGEVILQTYQPEHHAIQKAANYEYEDFIERETMYRKKLKYPPFTSFIKFTVTGADGEKLEKHVRTEVEVMEDIFKMNGLDFTVSAAPAMIPKVGPFYYYHVLVRGEDPGLIFRHWKMPKGWRADVDPIHTA